MAETIDFKIGKVPTIRLPEGGNFSASFDFTGLDLTGYDATLTARNAASQRRTPTFWSKSGITVSADNIAFDIAQDDTDDNTVDFSVTTGNGATDYALTVYDAGVIVFRIQGDIEWIEKVGTFDTETPADTSFSVTVSEGVSATVTITASGGGGGTSASEIASIIHAGTSKATPVDADEIPLSDSAASWGFKKLTWSNLKATLKSYFDTVYSTFNPASPGAIGGTTPAAITGTTVTANSGFVAAADQYITIEDSGAIKITGTGSTNHTSFSGIGNWYGNVAVFQSGVGIIAQFGSLGSGVNGLYCAGSIQLAGTTVASLGSAAVVGCLKFCTDETGGAIPVFSDGTNWRRVSDRAIAS